MSEKTRDKSRKSRRTSSLGRVKRQRHKGKRVRPAYWDLHRHLPPPQQAKTSGPFEAFHHRCERCGTERSGGPEIVDWAETHAMACGGRA